MDDGRSRIAFDGGDEHRYKPSSMHKLVLIAAPYAPPTAAGGDDPEPDPPGLLLRAGSNGSVSFD